MKSASKSQPSTSSPSKTSQNDSNDGPKPAGGDSSSESLLQVLLAQMKEMLGPMLDKQRDHLIKEVKEKTEEIIKLSGRHSKVICRSQGCR